jgi:hypothetical protein
VPPPGVLVRTLIGAMAGLVVGARSLVGTIAARPPGELRRGIGHRG